jgi:iron complex outermembrane recepter protein
VRVARNEINIASNAQGLLVTPLAPSKTSDSVQTYLLNTRYRLSADHSVYARAASGYRPAGVNLTTLDTNGNPVGQPSYRSDSLWSYEAGAKGVLLERRLRYDVSVYHVDWKDSQIAVTFASGLGGQGNARGGVRANGLELSLSGEPARNLTVTGPLGITNTKLKQDEPDLGGLAGERLPGNPKNSAALLADYRIPLSGGLEATLGATWRYTGSYNSSYKGGGGIAPAQPNYVNPSFSQFDLRAGLQRGNLSGNLYVTNVSDKRAYQSVLAFAPTYAQGVLIRPRTVGINVRYDFE